MYAPSGEYATELIASVGPCKGCPTDFHVCESHILTIISVDPDMMCAPSGEYVTELILAM